MPRGRPRKVKPEESPPTPESPPPVISGEEPVKIPGQPDFGFNILDEEEDVNDSIEQVLTSFTARRKNQTVDFSSIADIRETMLPVGNFYLQWALGFYGIPEGCLIDIIGAEGIGKTTLTFQLLGWAMSAGCPAHYIECEGKQLPTRRVLRALHPDKATAKKMAKRMRKSRVNSLEHLEQEIYDYVNAARGNITLKDAKTIPLRVPLVVAVDPWSKLMNPDEAAGFYDYGDNMSDAKKKKYKAAGTASNLGHAKWAHAFCRKLPYFLRKNNVILIFVHHQNDDIDMSGQGASRLPQIWKDLHNKKKLGGRATNQNAAIQLILARGSEIKDADKKVTGKEIHMLVDKNSFGPDKRQIKYELRTDSFYDTETTLEPAICFDNGMANWFADNKFLGTSLERKRFTSETLGLTSVTSQQFCSAFDASPKIKMQLGEQLNIEGYIDTWETLNREVVKQESAHITKEQPTPPPPPPPPPEEDAEELGDPEEIIAQIDQIQVNE